MSVANFALAKQESKGSSTVGDASEGRHMTVGEARKILWPDAESSPPLPPLPTAARSCCASTAVSVRRG